MQTGQVILQPGEHPFPSTYVGRRPWIRIEPSIYLDALVRDFRLFGGRIVLRKFDTPRDLMSLREPLIVNCTALGSRDLFGDTELTPFKGQLTFLVPQSEVNYRMGGVTPGSAGRRVSMVPRSDGIALGGTSEPGVWALEPNEEARRQIVEAAIGLTTAMRDEV